jgi:DNA-binding MarR family transcriptional regulator
MSSNQHNILKDLIDISNKVNSKVFNHSRFLILSIISYIRDGVQFRVLKNLLNISDGKLQADLENLNEMGYVEKIKVDLDNKKVTIYMITDSGKNEIKKIISWTEIIKKMKDTKDV